MAPSDDFIDGAGAAGLMRFCTLLHEAADISRLIHTVAGDALCVALCRQIALMPNAAFESRLRSICREHRLDENRIHRRALLVARALRLDRGAEATPVDYYAVLGVSPDADPQSIKQAYRTRAKSLHPDRQAAGADGFIRLQMAYYHLSDTDRRRRYDEQHRVDEKWETPMQHDEPLQPTHKGGRFWGLIGLLVAVLVATAFVFDLVYNEMSIDGPNRALPPAEDVRSEMAGAAGSTKQFPVPHTGPTGTGRTGSSIETEAPAVEYAATPVPFDLTPYPETPPAQPSGPVADVAIQEAHALGETPPDDAPPPAAQRSQTPPAQKAPVASAADGGGRSEGNDATSVRGGTGAHAIQTAPDPAPVSKDVTTAALLPGRSASAPDSSELKERLRAFIETYCRVYASKDLDEFLTFFSPDATEQGKPLHTHLPVYRSTFAQLRSMNYDIRILSYTPLPENGRVRLRGRFTAKYQQTDGAYGSSSGSISMELDAVDEGFRIRKLAYRHD